MLTNFQKYSCEKYFPSNQSGNENASRDREYRNMFAVLDVFPDQYSEHIDNFDLQEYKNEQKACQ